jgi:Uma2 family endonuclease
MPVISTTKMTARQYLMLGEDPPGVRLELVDGEVAVSPRPRPNHSQVGRQLSRVLGNHIADGDLGLLLGDTDTVFGENDVRRPDLIFFTKEREHLVLEDQAIDGMPDLCVEILSPSSVTIDRKDKFRQYAKGGVPYYWILDPAGRSIEGFELSRGKYKLTGSGSNSDVVTLPPFPKLKIALGEIWFPKRRK